MKLYTLYLIVQLAAGAEPVGFASEGEQMIPVMDFGSIHECIVAAPAYEAANIEAFCDMTTLENMPELEEKLQLEFDKDIRG